MNKIKELREERGINQKVLSIDLHVSQPTICDWENGKKKPSSKSAARLADYFNVSIDYLLGRTDVRSFVGAQQKQPTAEGDELRKEIICLLEDLHDLSDQEIQMVRDFVAMLKGHRGAAAAHPHPARPE